MLKAFDHVNIRTRNLQSMIAWYGDVLGLHPGARPPFPFAGAWLYIGDTAVVHLVEVDGNPIAGGDLALEHFSFRAAGMRAFRENLDARGVEYSIDPVPDYPIVQINLHDFDGNHIHVDFDASEYEAD